MIRGALHKAILPGDYGKPRPVLIVQSPETDVFDSLIVCPLTSDMQTSGPLRVELHPDAENQLKLPSVIMIEKVGGLAKTRIREKIGDVDRATMESVEERLVVLLGLSL